MSDYDGYLEPKKLEPRPDDCPTCGHKATPLGDAWIVCEHQFVPGGSETRPRDDGLTDWRASPDDEWQALTDAELHAKDDEAARHRQAN
jgi:hypothetical protein